MSNIEQKITSIEYLTLPQRATLRRFAGYCIGGRAGFFPETAPDWIDPNDYAALRRLAIEEAYKRRVAGQDWIAGKDKAFKESQGAARPGSVILTHKFL